MPNPREVDPLLPQTEQSPEISGYGSSIPKSNYESEIKYLQQQHHTHSVEVNDEEDYNVGNQESSNPGTQDRNRPPQSIWNSIIATLTFIVLCGFIASLLNPRRPSNPLLVPGPIHGPHGPNWTDPIFVRVRKILTSTPLIDGHNDLAIFIRGAYKNDIYTSEFQSKFESGGFPGDVDLHRLHKGMVGGAFWSAFVVCSANASTDFSDTQYATSTAHTIEQIDSIKRLQALYPANWTAAGTPLDENLRRFHDTRSLIGPISIEGLHQLSQPSALSTLRLYYTLGVRAATLTWNCHNAFADAALITTQSGTVIAPYHRSGLTSRGRTLLHEMNRLGMLIDLSHTSFWTQRAALSNSTSLAPVIYSHSSAYSLCPHPRNVHDSNLDLVRRTRSLVMVNFSPDFISCTGGNATTLPAFYPANNTLHQVARHIVYIGDRIGYDHVGLGSDFDGMGDVKPEGLEDVSKFPDLVAELLRMGVADADVEKVVGGNLIRVWREVEEVRDRLGKEGVNPFLDEVIGY